MKAKLLHKITGRQYFVVPFGKNGVKVVDNRYIKKYNQWAAKSNMPFIDNVRLHKMALFCTGTKPLTK